MLTVPPGRGWCQYQETASFATTTPNALHMTHFCGRKATANTQVSDPLGIFPVEVCDTHLARTELKEKAWT